MAATFTLEELTTPIPRADWEASLFAVLTPLGVAHAAWRPGAVLRTLIAVSAVFFAAFSLLVSSIARGGFLTLATGGWLTALARDVYRVEPATASYAQGYVALSNASGGFYDLDPGELEVSNTVTKASYRNAEAISIKAGDTNVPVLMRAVEVGAASSALIGEVTTVVTALAGLSVTNTEVFLGSDDESEDLLKTRCGEQLGGMSPNGPADAYAVAARAATRANGTNVGVTRIRTMPAPGARIRVCVATANGAVPGDASDPTTDLGAVDLAVRRYALPEGVTCETLSATEKRINVTATLWVNAGSGLSESDIRAAVIAELKSYFSEPITNPLGGASVPGSAGMLFVDDLRASIMRARTPAGQSVQAFRCTLQPADDVPLNPFDVAVLGDVELTVVRVASTAGGAA
jgi:hypothetical protein